MPSIEDRWIEAGFSAWPMHGSFVPPLATIWARFEGTQIRFRVVVRDTHLNGFDRVHGGFLSTMADIWLGYNVAHRLPTDARIVTSSLAVDYLRAGHAGSFLESAIDRIRIGRNVCHASGAILCEGELVATMRGSFHVLDPGGRL
jgi:uncharacterized protein (TIGR00369 family)